MPAERAIAQRITRLSPLAVPGDEAVRAKIRALRNKIGHD